MKAVVLAAGQGTRLRPLTLETPKPMLELGGQPILETISRQLAYYGFTEIIITSHYLSEKIEAYLPVLQSRLPSSVLVRHEPQAQLMGTSGGLSSIAGLGDDGAFLVMNGDLISTLNFKAVMDYHRERRPALTVGRYPSVQQIRLGVLETDEQGNLINYLEKPHMTFQVSMGVYIYEPSVLEHIPPHGWQDAPDLIMQLVKMGHTVATYPFDGEWLDVGTHDDFAVADNALRGEKRPLYLPYEG